MDETAQDKQYSFVNITTKPRSNGAGREDQLGGRALVLGKLRATRDETELRRRRTARICGQDGVDKELAEHPVELEIPYTDPQTDERSAARLTIRSMADFGADGVAAQVPELAKALELRAALQGLRTAATNRAQFRKKLDALLGDAATRRALGGAPSPPSS